MAKVDIIIPVYNTPEELFERCIRSILNQEFADFEILIIDDGSTKIYANWLDQYCNVDSRIRVVHKCNGGVSSARNVGIQISKAERIAFVDSDDQITADFFLQAIEYMDEYELDFIIGGNVIEGKEYEGFTPEIRIYSEIEHDLLIGYMISPDLISFGQSGYIGRGPWARIVRSEIARDVIFDEKLRISEDICWNIDVLKKAKRVGVVKSIWYIYSQQPESATRSYHAGMYEYIKDGLGAIKKRVQSKESAQYDAFLLRVLEDIRLLSKYYYCYLEPVARKDIREKVYCTYPWKHGGEVLLRRSCSLKWRCKSFLYNTRLILFLYWIRFRIG